MNNIWENKARNSLMLVMRKMYNKKKGEEKKEKEEHWKKAGNKNIKYVHLSVYLRDYK